MNATTAGLADSVNDVTLSEVSRGSGPAVV